MQNKTIHTPWGNNQWYSTVIINFLCVKIICIIITFLQLSEFKIVQDRNKKN